MQFNFKCKSIGAIGLLLIAFQGHAFEAGIAKFAAEQLEATATTTLPAVGSVEVGFSPRGGAQPLVLKVINSAKTDLKLMAYSFTSSKVTEALLRARKRGVAIHMVVDAKQTRGSTADRKAVSALSALSMAGAEVRTVSAFAIAHDKVIVADGVSVQTGSYNYSESAATRNSENVIVHWNNPALAKVYVEHMNRNWMLGTRFEPTY